jgi:predicted dehydrogenase
VKTAIVGCGNISHIHIPSALRNGASLVGVCDLDQKRASDTVSRYDSGKAYSDLQALLSGEHPDVVHVLTPPATHGRLAVQALEAGCHVLVEKPMAISTREAAQMIAVAERSGKVICVDHSRLFDPLVLEAKSYLARGHMGDLVTLEYFQGYPSIQSHVLRENPWIGDLELGVVQDLIPHALAFLIDFLGPIGSVQCVCSRTGLSSLAPCEEMKVLASAERGIGSFTISLSTQPFMCALVLYGTKMTVEIDFNNRTLLKKRERHVPGLLKRGLPAFEASTQLLLNLIVNTARYFTGKLGNYPGVDELICRFYRSLEAGTAPPVPAAQGLEVVQWMEQISEVGQRSMLCAS